MTMIITASILARASVACLATASLASMGYYLTATQPQTNQALARQQHVLQANQKRIGEWWEDEVSTIQADLTNPDIISRSLSILQARRQVRTNTSSPLSIGLATELNRHSWNRNSVSLLTRGGIVVFSTDPQKLGRYQPLKNTTTSLELHELRTTPLNFFRNSDSGLPSISVALPIRNGEQKRLGFLAIDLNLNRLNTLIGIDHQQQLEGQRLQPPMEAYLAARTTLEHVTHIAPPNLTTDYAIKTYTFKSLNSVGIQNALNGQSGQGLYLNPNSRPSIGVYQYLPNFRTALLVESLQRDVYTPARKHASIVFLSGIIISIALSFVGFLISHSTPDQWPATWLSIIFLTSSK